MPQQNGRSIIDRSMGAQGPVNLPAEPRFLTYLIVGDPAAGQYVSLDLGSTWRIGRTPENAVVLPADHVSRNHAMIQMTDRGEYFLLDLGSSNGTFLNGNRVSVPSLLKDGDQIRIGTSVLSFHSAG